MRKVLRTKAELFGGSDRGGVATSRELLDRRCAQLINRNEELAELNGVLNEEINEVEAAIRQLQEKLSGLKTKRKSNVHEYCINEYKITEFEKQLGEYSPVE